jgi:hypothetical protein
MLSGVLFNAMLNVHHVEFLYAEYRRCQNKLEHLSLAITINQLSLLLLQISCQFLPPGGIMGTRKEQIFEFLECN